MRKLFLVLCTVIGYSSVAIAAPQEPIFSVVEKEQKPFLVTLKDLVNIESGSRDREGLDKISLLISNKLKAAKLAGVVELFLAVGAIWRTSYQIYTGAQPEANTMIWISVLALAVNVTCLFLISKRKNDGVHMRASFIFSANDVLANVGVIIAGILVVWFNSPIPDWIIGLGIGFLVLSGALRILRLK